MDSLESSTPASENPYTLLFKATTMIPISHYALGLLILGVVFLYNFLEFHFFEDLVFRGSPVTLTYNSCSEIYQGVASKCRILHGRSVYHVGVNIGHKMIVNSSGRCTTSASSYGPLNRVQDADEEIGQIDVNNGFLVSGNPSSKLLGLEGSKFLEIW